MGHNGIHIVAWFEAVAGLLILAALVALILKLGAS